MLDRKQFTRELCMSLSDDGKGISPEMAMSVLERDGYCSQISGYGSDLPEEEAVKDLVLHYKSSEGGKGVENIVTVTKEEHRLIHTYMNNGFRYNMSMKQYARLSSKEKELYEGAEKIALCNKKREDLYVKLPVPGSSEPILSEGLVPFDWDIVREGIIKLTDRYEELREDFYMKGYIYLKGDDNGKFNSMISDVVVDRLPVEFSDCIGEYGDGTILISNIINYNSEVASLVATSGKSWERDEQCYTYYAMMPPEVSSTGFNVNNYIPMNGSWRWSNPKAVPEGYKNRILQALSKAGNPKISKLYMNGDEPVLSKSARNVGNCDYGLAEVIVEMFGKVPVKSVYFLGKCESYVISKCNDGEFTLTMF